MGSKSSHDHEKLQVEVEVYDGPNLINTLPEELIEAILANLDAYFLLRTASLVCQYWTDNVSKASLWRLKCLKDGLPDPASMHVESYMHYYMKLTHNLLKNAWADQGLQFWNKGRTGRHGQNHFAIEDCHNPAKDRGVGCQKIPEEARLEKDASIPPLNIVCRCWATTFYHLQASQEINLTELGCSDEFMDCDNRPDIYVSEWTAPRYDCASTYTMKVVLKGNSGAKDTVLDEFEETVEFDQWTEGEWRKVTHCFSPIPKGVRRIIFLHSGQDRQYWAGEYGSKFTGATVKLVFKPRRQDGLFL